MKKTLLAGVAALALTTGAAHAANDTNYTNWGGLPTNSGLYLGVGGGYNWADDDATAGLDLDGFEGGAFAGYRWGFVDWFALGAEIGWDFVNDIEDDAGGFGLDKRNSYYAELQPVITVNRDWNLFGNIGWQQAQFKGTTPVSVDTEAYDGLRYGLGVEYAYMQRTGIRAQVVQVQYDEEGGFEPEETSARAGVFYKF